MDKNNYNLFNLPHPIDLEIISDPNSKKKAFNCNQCCLIFESKLDFESHQKVTEKQKDSFITGEAEIFKYVVTTRNVDNYISDNKINRDYFCKDCNKSFSSYQGLRQHEGKIHIEKKRNFKCLSCTKKFYSRYLLRSHLRQVHETSNKFSCPFCKNSVLNEQDYRLHLDICSLKIKY